MKSLHTPVRSTEFLLPQEEREITSVEGQCAYAKGVLLDRLRRIVWTACMDGGPRAGDTIECIRTLVTAEWPDAPHVAVAVLFDLVEKGWDAPVRAIRAQGALTSEEVDTLVERRGVWMRYGEALELFAKYEVVLERIKTKPWNAAADLTLTESEVL